MANEITRQDGAIQQRGTLASAGEAANAAACRHIFADYRDGKPHTTLTAQRNDLQRFVVFLSDVGVETGDMHDDPAAWAGVTFGLVKAFMRWQSDEGYAIASINRALATVKRYAGLAFQAGIIPECEYRKIRSVTGYSRRQGRQVDSQRDAARRGAKKAHHTSISNDQAHALKEHDLETPQGRRDAVLMCLLIDHGLRESEVHDLQVTDFDMKRGRVVFYRRKVDKEQTHKLSTATARAIEAYLRYDAPLTGGLLRGSRKGGELTDSHMSISAIKQRVRALGAAVGIDRLSPHDCRHYWATRAAEKGVNPLRLQEAGGWSSLEMPRRYVEASKIANEGMVD